MCGREYEDTSTWFDTNGYNYSSEIFNTLCNMIRHIWNFLACSTFFFTPAVLKDLLFFVWIRETFLKPIIRHIFDFFFLCTYTCFRNQDCTGSFDRFWYTLKTSGTIWKYLLDYKEGISVFLRLGHLSFTNQFSKK